MKFGTKLKNFFIPNHENDFKPHSLSAEVFSIIIAVIFVIEWAMIGHSVLLSKNSDFLAEVLPSVLVDLTNSDRSLNSASSLTVNDKLTLAAQLKANDMASKGYFSHTTPEGFEPWVWLDKAGYSYAYAGENLAVNFFDSADVEKAWMNSPTHKQNLVKPEYTEVGIAMAKGKYKNQDTIFVVQFFGTPKVAKAQPVAVVPTPTEQPLKVASATKPTPSTSSGQATPTTIPATVASITPSVVPTTQAVQVAEVKAAETQTVHMPSPSLIKKALASPRTMDKYLLGTLIAIVVSFLGLAVLIEVKIQHKHLIANAFGLLIVIGLGLVINSHAFSYVTVTTYDEHVSTIVNAE